MIAPTIKNTPADLPGYVEYCWRRGWSFTPLAGKAPMLKGWQRAPRESLEQALAWARQGNVGLRTGRASGVVAIDLDEYKAKFDAAAVEALRLPVSVTALTGGGGKCLLVRTDARIGNSSGKLAPAVDVKGDNGQVVFPGSIHPDTGMAYTWAPSLAPWEVELAELPAHVVERLAGPPRRLPAAAPKTAPKPKSPAPTDGGPSGPVPSPNGRERKYAEMALRLELNAVATAAVGSRNQTLNKAAFSAGQFVGGGYLDRGEVEAQLRGAALSAGLDDREIERTMRSGIEAGMRKPRTVELKPPPKAPRPRPDYILLPGAHKDDQDRYTEQSNVTFADEVLAALPGDAIYRKDFIPGEVLGPNGKRKWVEFSPDRMRIVVDGFMRLGKWVTSRKSQEQVLLYQPCSKDAAGLVIAQARQAPRIRELELMVSYPIYGPDFRRVPPGWQGGLFYDEPAELRGLTPETDCEVIRNILDDLVVDFPFKTQADLENFLGLLLTPIVAPALDGNRPMHLINSPMERTGKTKLVNEILAGILVGREAPAMQITEREEEREKRILAMLLAGETLMHLDNLPHYVDSASLSSLLTAHVFGGRVLGASRTVKLANHLTIVGTGNNVATSGEIAKRIVPIMIEPTSAHPEARTDFQHPDLRAYVRQRRRLVLECLLGLVENWLAAGRPKHPNRFGGFESWSETIGGILKVNGFRDWRTNEGDWRKQADPQGAEMEAFVETWHEVLGAGEVTPKELRSLAEQNELFGYIFAKNGPAAVGVAFGRMLSRHVDKPVGAWFIRRSGASNHVKYRLEAIT